MKPFIRNDQYNFIKTQTQILISGHSSVNNTAVLHALKSLAAERTLNLFTGIDEEQKQLVEPIMEIKEKEQAEKYLAHLKPYVIPFSVNEQSIKKLFPKVKKLKIPSLEEVDLTELSYLGWNDKGTQRKYIVTYQNGKLVGLYGTFSPLNKKGICSICNKLEEAGMFLTETKGAVQGTFTKKGNYICRDSQKCNQNITSLDKLEDFVFLTK